MRIRALLVLFAIILVIGGGVSLLLLSEPREGVVAEVGGVERIANDTSVVKTDLLQEGTTAEGVQAQSRPGEDNPPHGQREPLREASALWGLVRSTDGEAIVGAQVSWAVANDLPQGWEKAWRVLAKQENERGPEAIVETDSKGLFRFEERLQLGSASGTVLIATFPGWMGEMRYLPTGSSLVASQEFVLEEAQELVATLSDGQGMPVQDATVLFRGVSGPPIWNGSGDDPSDEDLLRFLHREAKTGADGRASFGVVPGLLQVDAWRDQERALPWRGEAVASISLSLRQSFTLSGTVTLPPTEGAMALRPRLTVSRYLGSAWREIVAMEIDPAKPWGPVQVPIVDDAGQMLLNIVSSPLVPADYRFDVPAPGEHLEINLQLEEGETLWMAPVVAGTENEAPPEVVPNGRIRCSWRQNGDWAVHWFGADEDGVIEIQSVPNGIVRYEAHAPGYAPSIPTEIVVPMDPPYTLAVPVERGGVLEGTVFEEIEGSLRPCEEFTVYMWPANRIREKVAYPFEGRQEGSFVIETAQPGEMMVTATTERLPASAPIIVPIKVGARGNVEIQLHQGGTVEGRVIDGATGEPIASARIQLYVQGSSEAVSPWGPNHSCDSSGRFHLSGAVPGSNSAYFTADGYAASYETRTAMEGGGVNFGSIRLYRPTSLTVHLLGLDRVAGIDIARIRARLGGANTAASDNPSENDTFEFTEMNPGLNTLTLELDGTPFRGAYVDVYPGESKQIEIRFEGFPLHVSVSGKDKQLVKDAKWVHVAYFDEGGSRQSFAEALTSDGTAIFAAIPPGVVQVSVNDSDRRRLGATSFKKVAGEAQSVVVPIGGQEFVLTVLDSDGMPVQGARISLTPVGNKDDLAVGHTDEYGVCSFRGIPSEPLLLYVEHHISGSRLGVRLDDPGDSLEIILDPQRKLAVKVHDEGDAVEFALVRLLLRGSLSLASRHTDSGGLASFDGVGDGQVDFAVGGPGLWPTRGSIEVTRDSNEIDVQVWRTGRLSFECRAEGGAGLDGVALAIQHLDSGASIQDWLLEGALPDVGALRSSASGDLDLGEVPHGSYAWSATRAGYESATGIAILPRGGDRRVTISLIPQDQ